ADRGARGDHLDLFVEHLALGREDLGGELGMGHRGSLRRWVLRVCLPAFGLAFVAPSAALGPLAVTLGALGVTLGGLGVTLLLRLRAGGVASPTTAALLAALLDDLIDRALHEESPLRQVVVLAFEDFLEATDRLSDRNVHARSAGELLGDVKRLGEKTLDLARPGNREPVLVGELVDAENRDDVLELPIALEHLLNLICDVEVLVAENLRLED